MHAKKIETRAISRDQYRSYRDKAREFLGVMKMCLQDREWDAVLLLGVHACISMNDALTVFQVGLRSAGTDHRDACLLLSQSLADRDGVSKNASRLAEIIDQKHLVSYEAKKFTENEAFVFAQKVERFFDWAEKMLP